MLLGYASKLNNKSIALFNECPLQTPAPHPPPPKKKTKKKQKKNISFLFPNNGM